MRNITDLFNRFHQPIKGLVIHEASNAPDEEMYIEAYDMDHNGRMINAHPLDLTEVEVLLKALQLGGERRRAFLRPDGVLGKEVLYLNSQEDGFAIWFTSARKVQLHFLDELEIPSGFAYVPPLVWKASSTSLSLFAVPTSSRPTEQTLLCHAPFFNISSTGGVCLGTVAVDIADDCCLEEFMRKWQDYFYNSYFSHLLMEQSPIEGNIVQFWKKHMDEKNTFPVEVLKKNGLHLKDILK